MTEVILKAKNLVKTYGDKEVLKGVNVDIRAGEIFGLIGSSGSGKTTLLNALIGFVSPTKGEIVFRDPHLLSYTDANETHAAFRNVLHYPKQVKEIFGFAAQDPSVYAKLTVMENLDLFGSLYNLSKDARKTNAHILLKLMGLYNSRNFKASNLSGGMVKRLDIACSLIHDPKILILDEPTADLDPYLRRHMWDLIRKINKKGTTIIISSHYLDEIEELCDRIGIISNGKMKHYGTPDEIKKLDDGSEEIHLRTEYKRYDILIKKLKNHQPSFGISQIRNTGAELIFRCKNPLQTVEFLIKTTTKIEDAIVDLRLNKPSLNEIFSSFVEEDQGGDLATHQKNVEAEDKEKAKTKFWYKCKKKLNFMKKSPSRKHKTYRDVHLTKQEVLSKPVREVRKLPKQKHSSREQRGVTKNVFSVFRSKRKKQNHDVEFEKTIPKRTVVPKPMREQKQPKSVSFRPRNYKPSRFKEFFTRKPRARKSYSASSSGSDDTLAELAEIRKRIEKLRVDTHSLNTHRRSKK